MTTSTVVSSSLSFVARKSDREVIRFGFIFIPLGTAKDEDSMHFWSVSNVKPTACTRHGDRRTRFKRSSRLELYMMIVCLIHSFSIKSACHKTHHINVVARHHNMFRKQMPSATLIIRAKLLDHAQRHGLRRANGYIYEPFPTSTHGHHGQCTAYRERSAYEDYINEVLADLDVYTSNPKRFDDALKFLKTCTDPRLPPLHRDMDLISFANGILDMTTMSLYAPNEPDVFHRVARHYLPMEYTDSPLTPHLDVIFQAQSFDASQRESICAHVGRILIGDYTKPLCFVGASGTGKSVLMNVIQSMFAPGSVVQASSITSGRLNVKDKELILWRNMPLDTRSWRKAVQYSIYSRLPIVISSNHDSPPDMRDHIAIVRFDHIIIEPREDMSKCIIEHELANVVSRCLRACIS